MLANAQSYIATVSRQAELAKDLPMAHALADVVAALHRVGARSVLARIRRRDLAVITS
jgi:hypothetical protein